METDEEGKIEVQGKDKDKDKDKDSSTGFSEKISELGISDEDLRVSIRVLNSIASLNTRKKRKQDFKDSNDEGLEIYKSSQLRPLRKALAACLELHKRTMFQGKSEEEYYEKQKLERSLKRQKMAEKDLHKKYIADTALRKGRVERLNRLKEDAKDEEVKKMKMMIPDGHVDTKQTLMLEDKKDSNQANTPIQLPKLRSCYVCKIRYRELHHFYDQLCPSCASLNWEKRHQTANLHGRVAVVTGSRVKIGYQTCLKLLRAGATVVATTRFPNSAADTYQKEKDFAEWKDRLQIYGLDLRDVTGLEAFTRFLKVKFANGIDILINNACQTVRRPRGYYVPIVEKEQSLWSDSNDDHKSLLKGCTQFESLRHKLRTKHSHETNTPQIEGQVTNMLELKPDGTQANGNDSSVVALTASSVGTVAGKTDTRTFEHTGLSFSAAMSQMVILPEDVGVSDSVLPPGVTDVNGQQLDLRTTNSWLLKMEEVSTPEVMECMFINAIAPFVLNSRLKPLMGIPNDGSRPDRFIINVSAMEGKFYRYKMANHPHTNMAKAALNMLTRTSAEELATRHRIYMNAVDTGWINDENPLEKANKTAAVNLFQTPIDEIDAAARILDPVFTGITAGSSANKDYGKFLKDYRESEW